MSNLKRSRLDELKIKACLLFKSLKDPDIVKSGKAAQRFTKIPFLSGKTPEDIRADNSLLKLKHALLLMALENGCSSWTALREKIIQEDCLYANGGAFLNHWYADYQEAKAFHRSHGGYLLQYRKDYFVCEKTFVEHLGLSAFTKEWEAIGNDWTNRDNLNWQTIYKQAKQNYISMPLAYSKPDKSKRPE